MTDQQITDLMAQMIRVGFVNARQPEKMRVKVTIPDTTGAELVTDFLPVLCPRACEDMQYDLPDVGDQVVCLFLSYGLEQGFVIGAMYGKQAPPVQSGDKWHRKFKDGAMLEYDRANHSLNAAIPGTATIKCDGQITLEAPIVYVRGTLVNTARDGSPGKSVFSGGMTVTDGGVSVPDADVKASGVSLTSHTTDGVQAGGDTSMHPTGGSAESPGTATMSGNAENSGGSGSENDDHSGSGSGWLPQMPGLPVAGILADGISAALGANARKHLEALHEEVSETGSDIDRLIMCLPDIAEAMAAKAENEADEKGWLYLKAMFEKWLAGAANANANSCGNPLWVSWDWAIQYLPAKAAYQEFISKSLQEGTIYSLRAMQKLGEILCLNGYLDPELQSIEFDFVNSNPQLWEKYYFSLKPIKERINASLTAHGLYAAMGDFSLRALGAGFARNLGEGRWQIVLKKASVFIHDQFNFAGSEFLGFWSCEHLDGGRVFPGQGYSRLSNSIFRSFREKFGRGSDFLVLSKPHPVEDMKEASYVATCSE